MGELFLYALLSISVVCSLGLVLKFIITLIKTIYMTWKMSQKITSNTDLSIDLNEKAH